VAGSKTTALSTANHAAPTVQTMKGLKRRKKEKR